MKNPLLLAGDFLCIDIPILRACISVVAGFATVAGNTAIEYIG